MDGALRSLAKRIQEKFEDVAIAQPSQRQQHHAGRPGEEESEGVLQYIALWEKKWSELAKNSASNADTLKSVEAMVQHLCLQCNAYRETWRRSERDARELSELQNAVNALTDSLSRALQEASAIEDGIVRARKDKIAKDLEDFKTEGERQLAENDRVHSDKLNRLKAQRDSWAHDVQRTQAGGFSAVNQAAEEIRAQLARSSSQPVYKNLTDVELDIKIDKSYRVKRID